MNPSHKPGQADLAAASAPGDKWSLSRFGDEAGCLCRAGALGQPAAGSRGAQPQRASFGRQQEGWSVDGPSGPAGRSGARQVGPPAHLPIGGRFRASRRRAPRPWATRREDPTPGRCRRACTTRRGGGEHAVGRGRPRQRNLRRRAPPASSSYWATWAQVPTAGWCRFIVGAVARVTVCRATRAARGEADGGRT